MRPLSLTLMICLAGCHLLFPFEAPDPPQDASGDTSVVDGSPPDAPLSDAARADASIDLQLLVEAGPTCGMGLVSCLGVCVPGDDCSACSGGTLLCKATRACVSSCAGCFDGSKKPMPIECYACDTKQANPIGTCESSSPSDYCLKADYGLAHRGKAGLHCDCSDTKVSNCLGDHQVCLNSGSTDWCVTCGEVGMQTEGLLCKNGGTCDTTLAVPRCN